MVERLLLGLPEPWAELAVASGAFLVFLLAHVIIWRLRGAEKSGFVLMAGLWSASLAMMLAVVSRAADAGSLNTGPLNAGPVHGADPLHGAGPLHGVTIIAFGLLLLALYLHLYTGMLRSVSLRLLAELGAGALTMEEIRKVYSPASMLESRLRWMVERGLLTKDGDRYTLTSSGRRVLAIRRPFVAFFVEGPTG